MTKMLMLPCFLLVSLFVGCGTTRVVLNHETYRGPIIDNPVIAIGEFADYRKPEPDWLGAIRGGGTPLKTLRTTKPVKRVVQDAFLHALMQRGIYSEPSDAKYLLDVDIMQFDCNQVTRLESHVKLDVKVRAVATNKTVFSAWAAADNVEFTMAGGIFGSVEDLRKLAEKTLAQAVKKVFDKPEFRKLYQKEERVGRNTR